MLNRLDRLTPDTLTRLNRGAVEQPAAIRTLLERLRDERTILHNGINGRNQPILVQVEHVGEERVTLRLENFDRGSDSQIYLNFELDEVRYFLAAIPLEAPSTGRLEIEFPRAIFQAERRDLFRQSRDPDARDAHRVELRCDSGRTLTARVVDTSLYGMGVEIPTRESQDLPRRFVVRSLDSVKGDEAQARFCYATPQQERKGWTRIGLSLSEDLSARGIAVERHRHILNRNASGRVRDRMTWLGAALGGVSRRVVHRLGVPERESVEIPIVEYSNERGQRITAIVGSHGDPEGATAVVIPPAWGRTKETLLPLAATILETFQRAGRPVTVLRFDGTHRRGESYIDRECRLPGREYLHFTFSQAARDIEASVEFMERTYNPSTVVLVTFSLAAIEGRRAVALNLKRRIGGWVSVVGMVDLQASLRAISGGIDYGYGLLQGLRFGRHELIGVVADMDHTGLDAIEHKLGFLEESRRDFAAIDVPVTWIHGRHDAWMDVEGVREVLSHGDARRRRLIEVPTGHQLRTSREALDTFRLVAEEVSEMALGQRLRGVIPALPALERRRGAERARIPRRPVDLRAFWRDYLLGRDRRLGMQLLTATAAYRNFMGRQTRLLALQAGDQVVDLGSGNGDFPIGLVRQPGRPGSLQVDEVDYVVEALARGAERFAEWQENGVAVRRVVADLDPGAQRCLALADDHYDAAIASLLISYLSEPQAFLREVLRILKPGGRLVLSTLKRDADISKLYMDGMAEFAAPEARRTLGETAAQDFDALARSFLNDAARILDLEEEGRFRFWDPAEIADSVASAGFARVRTDLVFGDPPQAVVVSARKP